MRIIVNHPGPNWSVADVHRGWVNGLREAGAEIVEYAFHDRLWFFQNAQIERDGELVHAAPFDMATRLALEGLGSLIWETRPDAVMFISGFWVRPDVFDLIRARGTRVILLCTESPYQDDEQLELAAHADLTIINDPTNLDQFRAVCDQTIYVPHSYDPAIHRPGRSDKQTDVCIIGTGYPSRVQFLSSMNWDRIDLALLGNWTAAAGHDLAAYVVGGLDDCIDNAVAADWYRGAAMSINLYRKEHANEGSADGWAMGPREVELAACGTFFLTEPRGENREMLPMIPTFASADEAAELVRWYLDRPLRREQIAANARERIAEWTFVNRARDLLRAIS